MKTVTQIGDKLRRSLEQSGGGGVGMADNLLAFCRDHRLQLDWQPDRCLIRSGDGEWEEVADLTLHKSAFRSLLARVAVLCNERVADSVSPYGGRGELSFGTEPCTVFRVAFTNTPAEQRLELAIA